MAKTNTQKLLHAYYLADDIRLFNTFWDLYPDDPDAVLYHATTFGVAGIPNGGFSK